MSNRVTQAATSLLDLGGTPRQAFQGQGELKQKMNITESSAAGVLPALAQQLHRFFHHLDERRYAPMLELFTDDCRWLRQGQWLDGKAAVRDALDARSAAFDTRHVMSNAFVSALSPDAATAVLQASMTAYRYPAGQGDDAVPTIAGPFRFNLVTTTFRLVAGQGWRIAEQRMVAAFAFAQ
ncbi:SnoaL-like domain-containing protein [Variovorax sp. 770b2]|nr:SnoaL-like domain-containing protein [Variovorax sp. 770b2]